MYMMYILHALFFCLLTIKNIVVTLNETYYMTRLIFFSVKMLRENTPFFINYVKTRPSKNDDWYVFSILLQPITFSSYIILRYMLYKIEILRYNGMKSVLN